MKQICWIGLCVLIAGCSFLQLTDEKMDWHLLGTWKTNSTNGSPLVLTFRRNYTFAVDFEGDGKDDITGHYKFYLDMVEFTDDAPRVKSDCFDPGFYRYKIQGKTLTFELVTDTCPPRMSSLNYARIHQAMPPIIVRPVSLNLIKR